MNNFLRLSAAALVLSIASVSNAPAQTTVAASASATVITPVSIAKTTDMDFGNIAANASTNGTVMLAAAGTRTATGGTTLPATVGTVSAASFTVSGQPGYTYVITLPSANITLKDAGSNLMTARSFTSFPSATGTLSLGGTQILRVGATLDVSAAQTAGTYSTTTDFDVTVNYN